MGCGDLKDLATVDGDCVEHVSDVLPWIRRCDPPETRHRACTHTRRRGSDSRHACGSEFRGPGSTAGSAPRHAHSARTHTHRTPAHVRTLSFSPSSIVPPIACAHIGRHMHRHTRPSNTSQPSNLHTGTPVHHPPSSPTPNISLHMPTPLSPSSFPLPALLPPSPTTLLSP